MWLYSLFHIFTSIGPPFFMTHWIEHWQRPAHVKAIQTTNSLAQHQAFDIHPNHSKANLINQLVTDFSLPHVPIFLQQIHGNQITEYRQQPESQLAIQADACFTRCQNVICAVLSADCLPVLLTDSAGSFVAAVHCGWRSLFADILRETLIKVNSEHQIMAWLGPCIQQAQYQVDDSLVNNYLAKHPNSHPAFSQIRAGKSFANLYSLARIQLNGLGVKHIETANQCTFLNPNYYSWRQNNTTKRMASMLWLSAKQNS